MISREEAKNRFDALLVEQSNRFCSYMSVHLVHLGPDNSYRVLYSDGICYVDDEAYTRIYQVPFNDTKAMLNLVREAIIKNNGLVDVIARS